MFPKQKKNQGKRLLISVSVMGSAGPIRFVVNEDELVATVIDTSLKSYAREGRLPVLGSGQENFILYCPIAGTEALSPRETIGSVGVHNRNFMLSKKPKTENSDKKSSTVGLSRKGSWRAWFYKSLILKTSSP
ncbi:hypothetical protein CASFOL_009888 [Castilleja foliolosa]|uniref:DUF7054 domain-containing protein n=1 Tax=Castilleja foliolosa TaxID=1961234 RepID=A0ABD3DQY8_9LAMI